MNWRYLKSKQFFLTWLAVYLLMPVFWFHQLFFTYEARGNIFPFAGAQFGINFFDQLFVGDFGDALFILSLVIIPLIIYTFIISFLIHYIFLKLRNRRNRSA